MTLFEMIEKASEAIMSIQYRSYPWVMFLKISEGFGHLKLVVRLDATRFTRVKLSCYQEKKE